LVGVLRGLGFLSPVRPSLPFPPRREAPTFPAWSTLRGFNMPVDSVSKEERPTPHLYYAEVTPQVQKWCGKMYILFSEGLSFS
jgi:hypothetical protein